MNLGTYVKELRYALSAASNWRSRRALVSATLGFHLNNLIKSRDAHRSQKINVDLTIGDRSRSLTVRPYSGDMFILYEVLAFESYRIGRDSIDPEVVHTIIDCGANIGLTALYFAQRYPNARIISIEPDPTNFNLLQSNVAAEPRIVPVHAALVGSETDSIYLSQDRPAWGNSTSRVPGRAAVKVAAVTLEELCKYHGLDCIDLLKVDIEGAEEELFSKPDFLPKVRFVVIELHGDYTLDRFADDIRPFEFTAKAPGAHGGVRAVTAFPAN